jgi:hypothetical protein
LDFGCFGFSSTDSARPLLSLYYSGLPWLVHGVAEDRRAAFAGCRSGQHLRQAVTIEDIVAQDQRDRVPSYKVAADDEHTQGREELFEWRRRNLARFRRHRSEARRNKG